LLFAARYFAKRRRIAATRETPISANEREFRSTDVTAVAAAISVMKFNHGKDDFNSFVDILVGNLITREMIQIHS